MTNTFVLLHYPTAYSAPVGVWWWNPVTNTPKAYYMPGAENYQAGVVDLLGSAKSEVLWDQWCQKLADRTPYSHAFSADNINVSPMAYLRSMRHAPK